MARQAMGKGKMSKVDVADLVVKAGSTIINAAGKKFTLTADITAVYIIASAGKVTFRFDGNNFSTNVENCEIN